MQKGCNNLNFLFLMELKTILFTPGSQDCKFGPTSTWFVYLFPSKVNV